MGGQVGVHSTPDLGSTFWCTLPLRYDPANTVAATHPSVSLKGLRVLIADTHATSREILTEQARAWSLLPTVVESGEQVLDALWEAGTHRTPFDLLILDADLSVAKDPDLGSRINAQPGIRPLPIILITPRNNPGPEGAQEAGIVATLTRPVQQSELYDGLIVAAAGFARIAPVRPPEPPVQAVEAVQAGSGGRVLLVEDNLTNQMVAVGILTELGYQIDIASDGGQALEMLGRSSYRAVLMDCQMPTMDGYETAREVRRREAAAAMASPGGATTLGRTPIIAMTAAALKGDREHCLAAGMDDYLSKPFEPEDLAAVLHRWIPDAPPPPESAPAAIAGSSEQTIGRRIDRLRAHVPPGTVERLLTSFVEDGSRCVADLNAALARDDATALARAAHTLKGAATSIGAASLGALCESLEDLTHEPGLDGAAAILARLQGEYDTTRALLQHIPAG
jgi:CheY-like chemotaxis protein/HPt (histidine-containing phosphotransfer) domain-containing protein